MSENASKKPPKSILKTSNSVEKHDGASTSSRRAKEQRFDEMNIMATFHPADKDYGHMKIDEPKTPYAESADSLLLETNDQLDAGLLSAKLAAAQSQPQKSNETSDDEPEEPETQEEKVHRLEFEKKRKMHYNEFQAMQLARKLLEEEEDEEDSGEDNIKKRKEAKHTENTVCSQHLDNSATSSKP